MARFSVYLPNYLKRRADAELGPDETFSGILAEALEARLQLRATEPTCDSCGQRVREHHTHTEAG